MVFYDIIADMRSNKKRLEIVIEITIRDGKLNILVFITKNYMAVSKKSA